MNWDQIEGNWKQVTGKAKEQWGKLTDDDLDVINGRREQLEGKLQERYGFAADQIRNEVMHLGDDLGRLREAETRALLAGARHPARNPEQNLADLRAQVADRKSVV